MKWFIKVLRHYADFSGRARRREYWMFVLFNLLFFWAWTFLVALVIAGIGRDIQDALPNVYLSYYAMMLLPGLAVAVRRLHDIGKSGWMLLIALIPFIGGIWLLVLMLTKGEESENKYGPNPKTSAEIFSEPQKLKSAGVVLTVAASLGIIFFMGNTLPALLDGYWSFGQFINVIGYALLLAAGIFLLGGTSISYMQGKARNAMQLMLAASAVFLLMNINNIFSLGPTAWISFLSLLALVIFTVCCLYFQQNKDLLRILAIAVIVLSAMNFLWSAYFRISYGMPLNNWKDIFFLLFLLFPVAYIVFVATFYPPETVRQTNVVENNIHTNLQKPTETLSTPKIKEPEKVFTLSNLEKVRINTKESDIVAMFGQPDFKMTAETIFAKFATVPASERGKVYWTYKTPYGDLQVAIKDNLYVVATNGLESIIEKMKAELPEEKPDAAATEEILKEDIRFSIDAFKPLVTTPAFTKEEAYSMLEDYLTHLKPQKMSDDETELLKPLFMNLLIHFRNEAYLYMQAGRGMGGMCDACSGSISKDEFYLMGSWARCRKCALDSIVITLDWNYYLGHIISAIGQVPPSIVSQAYDIKDKITKRRQAL